MQTMRQCANCRQWRKLGVSNRMLDVLVAEMVFPSVKVDR